MALVRYDFNYNKALEWTAQCTDSKVYKQENVPADLALEQINKDISRTFYFPKNKYSNDTSQYFYSGWNDIRQPFDFIQGDMDGGGFVQPCWSYFAITREKNEEMVALMDKDDVRFGYVSDDNIRCSLVLVYNKQDPSKWMVSLTKNTDKVSFDERTVSLFISDHFCKDDKKIEKIDKKQAGELIAKALGSESLQQEVMKFFNEDGDVSIDHVEAFAKRQLIFYGRKYVIDRSPETPPGTPLGTPEQANEFTPVGYSYIPPLAGGGIGFGLGWLLGLYVFGPAFAIPTLGLSLLVAPAVCALIGMVLGIVAAHYAYSPDERVVAQDVHLDQEEPPSPPPRGGSHQRMAGRGLRRAPEIEVVISPPPIDGSKEAVVLTAPACTAINPLSPRALTQ